MRYDTLLDKIFITRLSSKIQMKHTVFIMGCICLLCFFVSTAEAFLFSPSFPLETTITDDTIAVFVGDTEMNGTFYGYRTELFEEFTPFINLLDEVNIDVQLFSNLHIFPFYGTIRFQGVEKVQLINTTRLQDISNQIDLLEFVTNIQSFSNVDVIVQKGLVLFGTDGHPVSIDEDMGLSFSALFQMPLNSEETVNILGMISDQSLQFNYDGNSSFIYPFSIDTTIVITNQQNNVLWRSSSQDILYVFEDESLLISDDPSFHLFPLQGATTPVSLHLSIQPSQIQSTTVNTIIETLQDLSAQLGNTSIPFVDDNSSLITDILPIISNIVNGGFILINTSNPVDIDQSIQQFSTIGFARSDQFDVIIPSSNPSVRIISGDFRLVFLGDHFYSPQAPHTNDGVGLPLVPLFLWGLAIVIYLLFHYMFDSKYPKRTYPLIKRYGLFLYLLSLLLMLLLLDREISYQFGSSMIDILLSQGLNLFFFVFLGFELLLFGLGFFLCAIPTSIIINHILRYFGFKKDTKAIGRIIGSCMIWVFAGLYAIIFFNVILLFIHLPSISGVL